MRLRRIVRGRGGRGHRHGRIGHGQARRMDGLRMGLPMRIGSRCETAGMIGIMIDVGDIGNNLDVTIMEEFEATIMAEHMVMAAYVEILGKATITVENKVKLPHFPFRQLGT